MALSKDELKAAILEKSLATRAGDEERARDQQ